MNMLQQDLIVTNAGVTSFGLAAIGAHPAKSCCPRFHSRLSLMPKYAPEGSASEGSYCDAATSFFELRISTWSSPLLYPRR